MPTLAGTLPAINTVFVAVISAVVTHTMLTYVARSRGVELVAGGEPKPEPADSQPEEPVSESDSDEAPPKEDNVVSVPGKHFGTKEVIWNSEDWCWDAYDPSLYAKDDHAQDPNNYFVVNRRHKKRGDEGQLVVTDFSTTLTHVLRSAIGSPFFGSHPEYELESIYSDLRRLHKKMDAAKSAFTSTTMTPDEKREIALDFGATEAKSPHFKDEDVEAYFKRAIEHFTVFLDYVDEQFKPTADRLALLTSYGQIEFDQLVYYFQPGDKYSTNDGDFAFVLESRHYYQTMTGRIFAMSGSGYEWNGQKYTKYSVDKEIFEFKGSREIRSLICKALTPELEATLKERGKLYTSLSGVHYKTYERSRVIVDRRAFNNRDGYNADPTDVIPKLDEDKLYLCPRTVYGFNLSKKKWMCFRVEALAPVVFDENAWDHLVLHQDTKVLIKGLVEVTRNANSSTKIISDVISGKGGGLISVLHGPPGTGKTLTAEAVAEHLRRPLYMVGSSELSTEPAELEHNLKGILSLATAWDAVLLIDEADVFLERRSLHELQRNALVSVALRELEYHRGVLFLTTNRIGTFDDAFLSRFSIGIKYPELDLAARRTIWRKFFELAGIHTGEAINGYDVVKIGKDQEEEVRAISTKDLEFLAAKPFNGRTIKNLVRTSQALALSSNESMTIDHIKVVVRASEKFLDEFGNP
ncbi:hypothetical protein JAAARDRAFT_43006 [Jaapia argillacea MUCL 33604]|uniref:AAA+ ATPase domain-containing protein n=1 Tax=Jaapia argillacea MUCL 33604 TaxID=933084 RepID=A0A067P5U8_9AGAM|nr:hypothetical protein JAAARDRAFT_43006 [Jaapia argillacea MUCL 33604]